MVQLEKKKKVLIVEDEAPIRGILKNYLMDMGIDAHEAEDGAVGYLKYKKVKYDLLIIDVTMPKLSGPELVHNIRSTDPDVKIVMLTSCADKEVITDVLAQGIQGWILKPFDEESFRAKVLKVLG